MRLAESKIRAALFHPEKEVRLTALSYFSRGRDETLMPLVIQAAEQFGPESGFDLLRDAEGLPQTPATVEWLAGVLSRPWDLEDVVNDNYCYAAAMLLCKARVDLLRPEMINLPCFPEVLRPLLEDRLKMASWDWDAGWAELKKIGEEVQDLGECRPGIARRADRVLEALARHADKADVLMPLLRRDDPDEDGELIYWLEPLLAELAGKMRLQSAVPILVDRMREEEFLMIDSCQTALQAIGGEQVVAALVQEWPEADSDFRIRAAEILEHIHTDASAEKCAEYFAVEKDKEVKDFLAEALLANFVIEAVEPVRQWALGEELVLEDSDLLFRLVAASTIMEVRFPEYDDWYNRAVKVKWGWADLDQERLRPEFLDDDDDDDFDGEDWKDDDWEDEYEEDWDENEDWKEEADEDRDREEEYRIEPFVKEQPPVGRNDPCPCGSGKKYKKCCLAKQKAVPQFPIGTVALYGPDDKQTTKIVAGVIAEEGEEPVIQRWVGDGVKNDPKVQASIMAFFAQHNVKSVVRAEKNMGCPHEEGEDFPVGGDCPFCPYWKGKQGSGAKR
jgi:hypothetical protein